MPRKQRRGRLESYRDLLVAIDISDGKITHVINWSGMNYQSIRKLLAGMITRGLIAMIEDKEDARSSYKFVITPKGRYLMPLLVELIDYVDDTAPAEIDLGKEPPVYIFRRAMALKGFQLEKPVQIEALPLLDEHLKNVSEFLEPDAIIPYSRWLTCLKCGRSIPSRKGMKIHISTKHKEEKKELLDKFEELYPIR